MIGSDIDMDDVLCCIGVNNTPLDFIVIDTTDTMALCLPVCDKPNKSFAFWLHKQDIELGLYAAINMFDLKHTMPLHPFLEPQHHAW